MTGEGGTFWSGVRNLGIKGVAFCKFRGVLDMIRLGEGGNPLDREGNKGAGKKESGNNGRLLSLS